MLDRRPWGGLDVEAAKFGCSSQNNSPKNPNPYPSSHPRRQSVLSDHAADEHDQRREQQRRHD